MMWDSWPPEAQIVFGGVAGIVSGALLLAVVYVVWWRK